MCGIYVAYANVPMMCQACDVSPEDSDTSIKGGGGMEIGYVGAWEELLHFLHHIG